ASIIRKEIVCFLRFHKVDLCLTNIMDDSAFETLSLQKRTAIGRSFQPDHLAENQDVRTESRLTAWNSCGKIRTEPRDEHSGAVSPEHRRAHREVPSIRAAAGLWRRNSCGTRRRVWSGCLS